MIKPDFLITPYVVKADKNLRPTDGDIYAVVYWFENLKDGECRAGNDTIAEILGIQENTVRAGFDRLEKNGYIKRYYLDKERRNRDRIETLIAFKYAKKGEKQDVAGIPNGPTPGDVAKKFFNGDEETVNNLVETIMKWSGGQGNEDGVKQEMRQFYLYWTEKNKSGTKMKWETERTFEIDKRLYRWFRGKFNYQKGTAKRQGIVV